MQLTPQQADLALKIIAAAQIPGVAVKAVAELQAALEAILVLSEDKRP